MELPNTCLVAYFEFVRLSIVIDIGIHNFDLKLSQLSSDIGPRRNKIQSVLISEISDHRLADRSILSCELRLKDQSPTGVRERSQSVLSFSDPEVRDPVGKRQPILDNGLGNAHRIDHRLGGLRPAQCLTISTLSAQAISASAEQENCRLLFEVLHSIEHEGKRIEQSDVSIVRRAHAA